MNYLVYNLNTFLIHYLSEKGYCMTYLHNSSNALDFYERYFDIGTVLL